MFYHDYVHGSIGNLNTITMAQVVRRYLNDDAILGILLIPSLMEAGKVMHKKVSAKGCTLSFFDCVRAIEQLRQEYL